MPYGLLQTRNICSYNALNNDLTQQNKRPFATLYKYCWQLQNDVVIGQFSGDGSEVVVVSGDSDLADVPDHMSSNEPCPILIYPDANKRVKKLWVEACLSTHPEMKEEPLHIRASNAYPGITAKEKTLEYNRS